MKIFMKKRQIDNFTLFMGKATGRKGMGMELALLVLFVVMACSILLVSSAMLGKSNLNDRKDDLTARMALDRVAEQALAGGIYENENYGITRDDTNNTLVITDADGNTLTVTWDGNNKITGWKYG